MVKPSGLPTLDLAEEVLLGNARRCKDGWSGWRWLGRRQQTRRLEPGWQSRRGWITRRQREGWWLARRQRKRSRFTRRQSEGGWFARWQSKRWRLAGRQRKRSRLARRQRKRS